MTISTVIIHTASRIATTFIATIVLTGNARTVIGVSGALCW